MSNQLFKETIEIFEHETNHDTEIKYDELNEQDKKILKQLQQEKKSTIVILEALIHHYRFPLILLLVH